MSTDRLHEHDLAQLLAELAPPTKPQYRDSIVHQTAGMRQRPSWTFVERWIPMTTYTSQAVRPPNAWRTAGAALLLVLALVLAAVTAMIVGSRQQRTVPPFGPAANGLVAFAADGDIFTADPITGAWKVLVGGDAIDSAPVWSRQGSHLAFTRTVPGQGSTLLVMAADGTGLREVATLAGPDSKYAFTPDGQGVLIVSGGEAILAGVDGTSPQTVVSGDAVREAAIRPGTTEIVYIAAGAVGPGIYARGAEAGGASARTIVAPQAGVAISALRVSPAGDRIAYSVGEDDPSANTYRVHVVGADGGGDVVLPKPDGATFQDAPEWSNDGTRLAITRGYGIWNEDMTVAVVPADGSGTGVESAHGVTGCCDTSMEWAPDDAWVLVLPQSTMGAPAQQFFVDPTSAATRPGAVGCDERSRRPAGRALNR